MCARLDAFGLWAHTASSSSLPMDIEQDTERDGILRDTYRLPCSAVRLVTSERASDVASPAELGVDLGAFGRHETPSSVVLKRSLGVGPCFGRPVLFKHRLRWVSTKDGIIITEIDPTQQRLTEFSLGFQNLVTLGHADRCVNIVGSLASATKVAGAPSSVCVSTECVLNTFLTRFHNHVCDFAFCSSVFIDVALLIPCSGTLTQVGFTTMSQIAMVPWMCYSHPNGLLLASPSTVGTKGRTDEICRGECQTQHDETPRVVETRVVSAMVSWGCLRKKRSARAARPRETLL